MIEQLERQYLSFKNISNPKRKKFQTQVYYTNRIGYGTNLNTRQNNEQGKVSESRKKKNVITSNSKKIQTLVQTSPRSNCEMISFSTDFTNKPKQLQTPRFTDSKGNKNENNTFLKHPYLINRLEKAQSDIKIIKTWEKSNKEKIISKQHTEQLIQEIPSKYLKDYNNLQAKQDKDKFGQLMKTLKSYEVKIKRLQKEIELKNSKIRELEKANSQKNRKQCQIESDLKLQHRYSNEQNRQNIRRLLNMLQMTEEYKEFAKFALDDNGVVLLTEANKKNMTKIDFKNQNTSKKSMRSHQCICSKEFIPEQYLWVPESIYEYGKEFLKTRHDESGEIKGFMSKSEYELLLYELNKMWRERQKRILNTITHQKNLEIEKLNRKFNVYGGDKQHSARQNSRY